MLRFNPERVWLNVREAATEDLLDRATVYRNGMEPEALEIIEAELNSRGVRPEQVEVHARKRQAETFPRPDGTVVPCSFCHHPAVSQGWGWHRMWGFLPLFPRYFWYCDRHRPAPKAEIDSQGP